jgi:uncharacterized membrane protein YccC
MSITASPWYQTYLTPDAQSLKFALKATLAMLLALYIALWLDLERPYWALISAAFLQIRPMSGMVLEKGLSQISGTLVGALAGITLMALFAQAPVPALVGLTLWIILCTYGSALLRNNAAYGCIMGAVTAMLIVVIGASAPDRIFSIAVARLSELTLGATCATLVSALLWPTRVSAHLERQADSVVNQAFTHAAYRLRDTADYAALEATLTDSLAPLTQLEGDSQAARYEGPEGAGHIVHGVPFGQAGLGGMDRQKVFQCLYHGGQAGPDVADAQAAGHRWHVRILEVPDDIADHGVVEGCIPVQGKDNISSGLLQTGIKR